MRQKVDKTFKDRAREVGEKKINLFPLQKPKNTWKRKDTAENREGMRRTEVRTTSIYILKWLTLPGKLT